MKINNIDIRKYNAKCLTIDIQSSTLENESEWISNALTPTFLRNKKGFKVIKLELYFKGTSRDVILNNISNFMINFINVVDLNFNSYKNTYRCILTSQETSKTISKTAYKLNLELKGYEYGLEESKNINLATSGTINNIGNIETPCTVEITPTVNILDGLTITGLSDSPIRVNNVPKDTTLIINSLDGTVTNAGVNKFSDADMWEFPRLVAGTNTIKFSKNTCNVKLKWTPRYF